MAASKKGRPIKDSSPLQTISKAEMPVKETIKTNKTMEETKGEPQNKTMPADNAKRPPPPKARNDNKPLEMPDVGIFSNHPVISLNQESPLEGFCATFAEARSTRNKKENAREHTDDDDEETPAAWQLPPEQEDKKNQNGADEYKAEMPAAKKQCTNTSFRNPSLLLKFHADIFQNVYSFLTLKEAVVLRRTCQELYRDSNMFRCSILGSTTIQIVDLQSRPAVPLRGTERGLRQGEERALYNLASAANVRALFRNETLPARIAKDYIKNLIAKSLMDNGEAVSVALQDGRCLVEPSMLDKALRKDYAAMAAALQQDETVRAAIQMCSTCNANIACYACFRGDKCKNLSTKQKEAKPLDSNLLPKYCKSCTLASNMLFCQCGEAVCRSKCSMQVPSCVDCSAMACGQAECLLEECDECGDFRCDSCGLYCTPCYQSNQDYDDEYCCEHYYGYDDDSGHGF